MAGKIGKYLFLKNKPWWVKLWFYSGLVALLYYLSRAFIFEGHSLSTIDAALMGYGMSTLALFVLIYGFDWK